MSQTSVSIIIPCFRQGRYLPVAIESALSQTHQAIEVIVVNDGSDDDTESIALHYGKQIKYLHQQNAGLPAARNAGIRAANGDYLCFLDSDDKLRPDGISSLLSVTNPSCMAVGKFGYFCDNDSKILPEPRGRPDEELMHGLPNDFAIFVGNLASPCAFLSPRLPVLAIGMFDTNSKYYGCEDWDLWTRLVLNGVSIRSLDSVVSDYRLHENSMTSKNSLRMDLAQFHLLERNLKSLPGITELFVKHKLDRSEVDWRIRKMMKKCLLSICYAYSKSGAFRDAYRSLRQSVHWGGFSIRDTVALTKIGTLAMKHVFTPVVPGK